MGDVDEVDYRARIEAAIRGALNSAEESQDSRDEEPWLVELVALVEAEPDHHHAGISALCGLTPMLGDPNVMGVVELLGYCVHVLRPPMLLAAVQKQAESGPLLRAFDNARRCERVLEAADDAWPESELYESLAMD